MTEHLYIHWPFCKKKCWYCDFTSFAKQNDYIEQYHQALCNEIISFAKAHKKKPKIKTIFFGGGTPSLYPLPLLTELFDVLRKNFILDDAQEITIEVNPGTVTKKHLETWKKLGINRLSIGVQILDETILKKINRDQTNRSVIDLLTIAQLSKKNNLCVYPYFDSVSVDLILGLPGTTTKIWFDTLDYLTSQKINHISIYFLTIYEKTPLYFKIQDKSITLPDEDWFIETYTKTIDFLEQKNYLQYEISNFAKPGFESIHNRAYWDRKPYQGFGISAASFDGKKRLVNSKNLIEYIGCWHNAKSQGCFTQETLTPENVFLEELMLGLRQKKGVDLQRMVYSLRKAKQRSFVEKVSELQKQGLIKKENGHIFLTTRGLVLENEVILHVI